MKSSSLWAAALLLVGQSAGLASAFQFHAASERIISPIVFYSPDGTTTTATSVSASASASTPASTAAVTAGDKASVVLNPALDPLRARLGKVLPRLPTMAVAVDSEPDDGVDNWVLPDGTKYSNSTFQQPVDHFNASEGTFANRFWFSTKYWKGPGSPVILFMPGEVDASQYLFMFTNGMLSGLYAETFGALVIVLEHRYFGKSLPFDTFTAETLRFLELPQSMKDVTNFAMNSFDLGGDLGSSETADQVPWILMGGSYPGALTAWIQQKEPGVFWAYHASSAVVETKTDFSDYFLPIREALPSNCSADIRAVVRYVDHVLDVGTADEIAALKTAFGAPQLRNDDFTHLLATPLIRWQDAPDAVYAFCDIIENTTGTDLLPSHPGPIGLTMALERYAEIVRDEFALVCVVDGVDQCDSYNSSNYDVLFNTPNDIEDGYRAWMWLCCNNPFGWFQVGPKVSDGSNVVSKYIDVNYVQRQCPLLFPETNGYMSGSETGWTPEHLNIFTGGYDAPFERVLFVNGELDPWRDVTVSSDTRVDGRRSGTKDMPIFVVPNGNHCPELNAVENDDMPDLYSDMVGIMAGWLQEYKDTH